MEAVGAEMAKELTLLPVLLVAASAAAARLTANFVQLGHHTRSNAPLLPK